MADTPQRLPRKTIEIGYSAPIRTQDKRWKLAVWATVKQGTHLQNGEQVVFYADGKEQEDERTTNSNGRTNPVEISFPLETRKSRIEVHISGEAVSDYRDVEFGPQNKIPVDKWSVKEQGSEGRYVVLVTTTSQDQLPVQGIMIYITDTLMGDRGPIVSGRTNEDGFILLTIPPFTQSYRSFLVTAVGTKLDQETLRLSGPMPPHLRRPPIPPSLPYESGFGLMKTIRAALAAYRQGKVDKKRIRSS